MSTKAIRKASRDMQCDYNPCLPGTCRKHEALAEVEAIERAAKAWTRPMAAGRSEWMKMGNVLTAIAKDAP